MKVVYEWQRSLHFFTMRKETVLISPKVLNRKDTDAVFYLLFNLLLSTDLLSEPLLYLGDGVYYSNKMRL